MFRFLFLFSFCLSFSIAVKASDLAYDTITGNHVGIPIPKNTYQIYTHDSIPIVFFIIDNSNLLHSKLSMEAYSLENGYYLWETRLTNGEYITSCHNGILFCDSGSTTLRDYHSGEKIWKQGFTITNSSPHDSIAYAIKSREVSAIDLRTGTRIWKSSTKHDNLSRWDLVAQPNDTTQIYLSNNLLMLNPNKGVVKEFKFDKTYKQLNAYSMFFGALTGALTPLFPQFYDYYNGLGSNVVDTDSLLFVADRKTLRCIDSDLNEIWKTKLPFAYPSESSGPSLLSFRSDTLELLNTGLVINFEDTIKVSQPFVATFDAKTGKRISKETYPEKFNTGLFGKRVTYILSPFYIYDSDTKTYKQYQHQPFKYPVKTEAGEFFIVDTKLGFIDKFTVSEIYHAVETYKGFTILSHKVSDEPNSWMYFIIDGEGKMIEGTNTDKQTYFVDHGFRYVVDGDYFKPAPF